jgi:hypothetical protein
VVSNQTQNFTALFISATGLGASPNPGISGQNVTFTATVTGSTPTGTVTFRDGATVLCSSVPLVNGQAACATSALTLGSHSVTADYSGDSYNTASTSPAVSQDIGAPRHTLTLKKTGNGSVFADEVALSWSNGEWSASYDDGVSVGLRAVADHCATFSGWGGDYQSGLLSVSLPMDEDLEITAAFSANLAVYDATTNREYATLSGLSLEIADNDHIALQAGGLDEVFLIDNQGLEITGGVDCDYQAQEASTTIRQLIIRNGSATVGGIIIR